MKPFFWITIILWLALAPCFAQPREPHIGYVYPAGGRQGSTFQVVVAGQHLAGVTNAYVCGEGAAAAVLEYNRPMPMKEFNEVRDELRALQQKRRSTAKIARAHPAAKLNPTNTWTAADQTRFVQLRDKLFRNPPNRQGTPAIAETVLVQITLASNAPAGARELRLRTAQGLSNPLVFHAGSLPEFSRPAEKSLSPELVRLRKQFGLQTQDPATRPPLYVSLPATVNGQILPGGTDSYLFKARAGQKLVFSVSARELVPYLADAVPGWFEATLKLYDAQGTELAHAARYRFHPDPVLSCEIPRDGQYRIEIRDALYRGREDFVYRLTAGELPFVTSVFPLGGRIGAQTPVALQGWNLPKTQLMFDHPDAQPGVCSISQGEIPCFNEVPFAVGDLPEIDERETNNSIETAQAVRLPVVINGRIDKPGDQDVFQIEGRIDQEIVAEVTARALGSPLDSVLELTDGAGRRLAFSDDEEDRSAGLATHHADSRILAALPAGSRCWIRLGDIQQQGGAEYGYRLRLSPARPDFDLRVVPSAVNVRAGLSVPITVYALRKDGFTNAIDLALEGPSGGFSLSGARVPANQDQIRLTLSAPPSTTPQPVKLRLQGRAVIQGNPVMRQAVPADDVMQAFAYRHLVPAREWVGTVVGRGGWARNRTRDSATAAVQIPAGGAARVRVAAPGNALAERFEFELSEPPEGVTLKEVAPAPGGLELTLASDGAKSKAGLSGNLIVQLIPRPRQTDAQKTQRATQPRSAVGVLPAIMYEIVRQETDKGFPLPRHRDE